MTELPPVQNVAVTAEHWKRTSQEEKAERSRWAPAWVRALLVSFCQKNHMQELHDILQHFWPQNILTSRKAVHFTEKNPLTKLKTE